MAFLVLLYFHGRKYSGAFEIVLEKKEHLK